MTEENPIKGRCTVGSLTLGVNSGSVKPYETPKEWGKEIKPYMIIHASPWTYIGGDGLHRLISSLNKSPDHGEMELFQDDRIVYCHGVENSGSCVGCKYSRDV